MNTELLKQIGLTNREIEVYLNLIKQGESPAAALLKDSSISRTHVYEALNTLIQKGLVSTAIKNYKKYYQAAPPETILICLENKQKQIEKQKTEAKSLIKQLSEIQNHTTQTPNIKVYEGKEGIKTILMDMIKKPKSELLMFNVTSHFKEMFNYFAEHFFREKIKRHIKSKVIFTEKFEFLDQTAEKRFMQKEDISPTTTIISQTKVAILFWLERPIGILIESNEAVKEYTHNFNILWKQSQKI